jgi:hypothetical protein
MILTMPNIRRACQVGRDGMHRTSTLGEGFFPDEDEVD